MLVDEINALDPEAFELMLSYKWAVSRRDIYSGAVIAPRSVNASQPMRPMEVLTRLKISQATLVAILTAGDLPRPGRLDDARVAWRKDEVEGLVPLKER